MARTDVEQVPNNETDQLSEEKGKQDLTPDDKAHIQHEQDAAHDVKVEEADNLEELPLNAVAICLGATTSTTATPAERST